jgi:hypothetical protein
MTEYPNPLLIRLGLAGEAGSGKTFLPASAFNSKYIDPERVLYIDNHGSTKALALPQYTATHRSGVWHVPYDQADKVYQMAENIEKFAKRGSPMFDLIIFDDLTQADLTGMYAIKEGGSNGGMQDWGDHLQNLCEAFWRFDPDVSKATFVIIARLGELPDLSEKMSGKRDKKGDLVDDRMKIYRPMIRGQFGGYILHYPDILAWTECKGRRDFNLLLEAPPRHGGKFKNRYWHLKEMPAKIPMPTWDKFHDMMVPVLAAEEARQEEINRKIKGE